MRITDARSGPLLSVLLVAVLAAIVAFLVPEGTSGDLRAFWLAGQFLAAGDPGSVYPPPAPLYTLDVPPAWIGTGDDRTLYPFIYPPIWAVLSGWIGGLTSFETFATVLHKINACTLVGTVALAWRATGERLGFPVFLLLGSAMLAASFVGALGLMENQPQILVSFLLVLALERSRSGHAVAAGLALALAASIKGYPAVFVLLWIATGHRREALAFTGFGAVMAGVSVAIAGWPLHAAFLAQLATISNTILLTPVSYGIAPFLTQVFAPEILTLSETAHGPAYRVGAMPTAFGLLGKAALLGAVAGIAMAMRRTDAETRDAMLWPLALVTVSLLSPLAWSYHYIPAVAAAPVLIDRFGPRLGGALLMAVTVPLSGPVIALYLHAGPLLAPAQAVGTLLMLVLAAAYLAGARAPKPNPALTDPA